MMSESKSSENHHANECECYRMRGNTFDAINYINMYRILMILASFEGAFKALFHGIKVIKIRYISVQLVASKVFPLIR